MSWTVVITLTSARHIPTYLFLYQGGERIPFRARRRPDESLFLFTATQSDSQNVKYTVDTEGLSARAGE